jgi:hypothetical protein
VEFHESMTVYAITWTHASHLTKREGTSCTGYQPDFGASSVGIFGRLSLGSLLVLCLGGALKISRNT